MATVLFNDFILQRQLTGIGNYAAQLLQHLPEVAPDLEILPLSRTLRAKPAISLLRFYEKTRNAESEEPSRDLGWVGRTRGHALRWAKRNGFEVLDSYVRTLFRQGKRWEIFHEPDAIPYDLGVPTISTITDLSVLMFPEWHPSYRVRKYEHQFQQAVERTKLFITISEATKRDAERLLGLDPANVISIPLAPRPQFRFLADKSRDVIRRHYGLPEQFFLYVGTLEPRKNIGGLLEAYGQLSHSLQSQFPLVLAGAWGWHTEPIRERLARARWRDQVKVLGFVPDPHLVGLMNAASALVYPSFYEGFGLPPVEAMCCGLPVISSHAGGLEEAVGGAARIVDPQDPADIAAAMAELAEDRELRGDYRLRGWDHVKQFSWKNTASATAEVYRRLIN